MELLPDWRDILREAWSIRFIVLAGLLSGIEVLLPLAGPDWLGLPVGVFAGLSALAAAAAFVARLLAQRRRRNA